MKKFGLICCFLVIVWFAMPSQETRSDKATSFDDFVSELMTESAIPGMAIAKIENGNVLFAKGYGLADIDTNRLVTKDTLFNVASISKPIMGIVLLQLVEQGKLELDKDINDYLTFEVNNPHLEGEIITVRHLATHTSGIDDYYDVNSYGINQDPSISLGEHLISLLTPNGEKYSNGRYYLPNKPGEIRAYSNLAAGLAGHLVESVTGLTLAAYSKLYLFEKLNMKNTGWLVKDVDLSNTATPYEVSQCVPYLAICSDTESPKSNFLISKIFNPPIQYKNYSPYPHFGNPQYPDGGIRSSISELSQLLAAVLNNRNADGHPLLSDEIHKEMFKLQLPAAVSDSQRFFWRDRNGLTGHMGSDLGVFSSLYFDIQSKNGFIVLMNRGMDGKSGYALKQLSTRLEDYISPINLTSI
jgi:CubicO group peptidase (beta-lactamase class C family)